MTAIDESKSVAYYNSLPGIRMGAGVLIFNERGDMLVIKPNYRNKWHWPGGGSEPGESPQAVAARECLEEIGVHLPLRPAFIDYVPPQEDGTTNSIQFLFTTGPVPNDFVDSLVLEEEIVDAKFVPTTELVNYMKPWRVRAVENYLQHRQMGAMVYLEDGKLVA